MAADRVVNLHPKPGYLVAELAGADPANRLSTQLITELLEAVEAAEQDPECRALVLTSQGTYFCAGAELVRSSTDSVDWDADHFTALLTRLTTASVVTIAVVDKPATGGGSGLAAACDVVIAHPDAHFRLTEVCFGMLPTIILPHIARRVGEFRVLQLAMFADHIPAARAVELGWADQVTDNPMAAVRTVLRSLRRSEKDTIADLKMAHRALFPVDDRYAALAARVFGVRFDDPRVAARIASFAKEGLL
ncbi:polyketide biosynthesis enoyl-CoA hydratase PksH [Crossiella equi]|uniref:Polyketide biosynthesis enoyl-CoA hydratase PksH n=1 Tax=Crossiella equi TaxID=130796 RepID=A0ABS5AUS8_9PSEU|nr:enoyl-CoA hydratase/isomerase family protein [Crossiella equi]MBP2479455.1 polyketide biosynthesis enoyl-CoA hydratase PksH [Crossiella equi]